MVTCRFKSKKYIHSLEDRAACLPLIVFKELTPGLKAFRAPLQHRPTAPNMVKMAEGEDSHSPVPFSPAACLSMRSLSWCYPLTHRRGGSKNQDTRVQHGGHQHFRISGLAVAATLMLHDDIIEVFVFHEAIHVLSKITPISHKIRVVKI